MKVLFICEGNMMRSQMAEAFYNALTKSHDAESAGATAETDKDHISKRAIEAMDDIGIETRHLRPLQLTEAMMNEFDRIVYFPSDFMPDYVKKNPKSELWDVVDPHYHPEHGMELVKTVRDDIQSRVEKMITTSNTENEAE